MASTPAKLLTKQTKADIYQPDVCVPLKEDIVAERFPRSSLIGEFALADHDNTTVRWYRQTKPDKKLGHKPYFGILIQNGSLFVIGKTLKEFKDGRFRQGLHCLVCNVITYSRYRHDYHSCECGNVFVDGGPAYFRAGYTNKEMSKTVKIDLLKQRVVDE